MNVRAKYIQIIGDAILPLLGFFLWNWDLYFIIIFYLLDLLVKEVLIHFKSRKIVGYQTENGNWWKFGMTGSALFILVISIIHLVILRIQPDISFYDEWIKFMLYEDIGIAQGVVIIPLLILVGVQQYKMEFLLPKLYERQTLAELWLTHYRTFFVLTACVGFTLALSVWFVFEQSIYVFSTVSVILLYQFYLAYKNS